MIIHKMYRKKSRTFNSHGRKIDCVLEREGWFIFGIFPFYIKTTSIRTFE